MAPIQFVGVPQKIMLSALKIQKKVKHVREIQIASKHQVDQIGVQDPKLQIVTLMIQFSQENGLY